MIKTILAAIDGSDLSDRVIETINELKLEADSKIILVHVILTLGNEAEITADRPQNYAEEIPFRHIEKQLQTYQTNFSCTSDIEIVSGDPAEEIVRLANIYHVDLIVIGSRGLTGFKKIVEGSVSSQVVENSHCSVLVVKPT